MKNKEDLNFDIGFDPDRVGYNDSQNSSWIDNYEPQPREKKSKKSQKKQTRSSDAIIEDYPTSQENSTATSPSKKERKKSKSHNSGEPRELPQFVKFFLDKRTHAVAGIALILLAAYLLISAMSYFSTSRSDQSVTENLPVEQTITSGETVSNLGGPVGAKVSHFMVTKGWGIGSFALIFYIIAVGLVLVGMRKRFHFWSLTFKCLLTAIGISLIIGLAEIYIQSDRAFPLGGYHGRHVNLWLIERIGMIGTLAVSLLLFAVLFTLYYHDIKKLIDKWLGRRRAIRDDNNHQQLPDETHSVDPLPEAAQPISDEPAETSVSTGIPHETAPEPEPEPEHEMMTVTAEFDDSSEASYETPERLDKKAETPEIKVIDEPGFQVTSGTIEAGKEADTALYDPTAELSHYHRPTLDLLIDRGNTTNSVDLNEQEENKARITKTLLDYGIPIAHIDATVGPTVTLYEIIPAEGVRISKIKNLEDDIALSLAALGIRIIAPIPGKGTIGIEVPNKDPQTVSIRSVLGSKAFQECKYQLPMAMGATISNEVYIADLAKMPHLLVAGATGQGKSVGLNTIIASLLYKKHPSELKFVLVDPKEVEFSLYEKLQNHFMAQLPDDDTAVVTNMDKVERTLNSLCVEMDSRYSLLRDANVRTIIEYNQKFMERRLNPEKGHRYLPYIVLIIDEFADLIMTSGKAIETPIARITAKARAVGIHLIIATQRPSTNVITGLIKANVPGRIAFRVSQMIESKIILDRTGANQLIGRGDMLFSCNGVMSRVQCAFIDTPEVEAMVKSIAEQPGFDHPYFLPEPPTPDSEISVGNLTDRDPLFEDAARYLCSTGDTASTSSLQRRFSIGYNRAGKIMDQLEAAGIVGPAQGSKPRTLLIDLMQLDMMIGK